MYADRDNGPTPSPFPILPPYLPLPDRMVHHDRTATAIRSTNQSIFLYVTEKMEVVFVEDGDGDGVERGGKARCWRGKGEDRVERGWGGWCLSFGVLNMFILSYRWLSHLINRSTTSQFHPQTNHQQALSWAPENTNTQEYPLELSSIFVDGLSCKGIKFI